MVSGAGIGYILDGTVVEFYEGTVVEFIKESDLWLRIWRTVRLW